MATTWTYRLETEHDPLQRVGIHGLWRHLTYRAAQLPAGVTWEAGSTELRVSWTDLAGLNELVDSSLGEFEHGLAEAPGYATAPGDLGMYATALAHVAITAELFNPASANARRRSKSLADKATRKAWQEAHPAQVVMESVALLERADGKPVRLRVSPHSRWGRKKTVDLKKADPGVFHPVVAKWNEYPPKVGLRERLPLAMSCHGYAYARCRDGLVAVGLDLPTFEDADTLHRRHGLRVVEATRLGMLWYVMSGPQVAAMALLGHLHAPRGVYPVYAKTGGRVGTFDVRRTDKADGLVGRFTDALAAGLIDEDPGGVLRRLGSMAVPGGRGTIHDLVLANIERGLFWGRGLGTVDPPKPWERHALETLVMAMETPMENALQTAMRGLVVRMALDYQETGYQDPWAKAIEYARIRLNRAGNARMVQQALAEIVQEAGRGFTMPIQQEINARLGADPLALRDLLLLGCYRRQARDAAPRFAQEAEFSVAVAMAVDGMLDLDLKSAGGRQAALDHLVNALGTSPSAALLDEPEEEM